MTDMTRPEHSIETGHTVPIVGAVGRELRICWAFSAGDLTATVIPATTFAVAGWMSAGAVIWSLPVLLTECLAYFWLYIYTFNLSNQLVGIDEDRLNKPHRPLVTGLVTPNGTRKRLAVTTSVFLVLGAQIGVLEWAALWVGAWLFHNHLGGARTMWGKNAAMVVGTIAQLAAAWHLATPLTATAWTWILSIALPLAVLVSLQDLRDVTGDAAVGRRTAITVFGEYGCRRFFSAAFAIYPPLLYVVLYRDSSTAALTIGTLAATLSYTISYRVIRLRTRRADNTTYLLYTYWYCATLVSAIAACTH
ncbi:UbiA family prenyltransferase [Nocardia brasiliensis]|uniref:UbiA family prenyltransferase n=1 Tax=Nocardia brasiliensis TaxID=37326 RepID=UPI0024562AF0|nr:UbiA family prenyltransferase [Nocardia brasiliensis]